ncbi:MAG: hypothetical protein R3Y60_02630 [bacterium]
MFLSLLQEKEKLKFLDLAMYMVDIDGTATELETKLLGRMFHEVGHVVSEYSFENSSSIDDTIEFFKKANRVVKNIVFLNLVMISMSEDLYNTTEHLFLEKLQKTFDITAERRRELMSVIYDERDLRERASRIIKE